MNYRHAFHAGSFADVMKHAALARILVHLRAKPAPFRVLDTHAGAGVYDLSGPEASRTCEWREGIGRLRSASLSGRATDLLSAYLEAVAALNRDGELRLYPGSPRIALSLLRGEDRLIACETQADAVAALKAAFVRGEGDERGERGETGEPSGGHEPGEPEGRDKRGGRRASEGRDERLRDGGRLRRTRRDKRDARAKVIEIDGWLALNAYVPPPERRGLVVIDSPFEDRDEFTRLAEAFVAAHRKWPSGIYLLWYPIKDRVGPDALAHALRAAGIAKLLRAELMVAPADGERLAGSGLIIANPPWTLADDLGVLLPELAANLGRDGRGGWRCDRLDNENEQR